MKNNNSKEEEESRTNSYSSGEIHNNKNNYLKNPNQNNFKLTKFTFKKQSTIKNMNSNNKESLVLNKKNYIKKETNKKSNSSIKSISKNNDNFTEKISYSSDNNNNILILEDINTNFAKKIKRKINERNKIQKIKNLFESQNQKYKNNLIDIYAEFNQSQKLNTKKYNSTNLYNIIHEKILDTSFPISNNRIFSQIIGSEEDSNLSTRRNSYFNSKSLKQVLNESFEIKSSYGNLNMLSKGEIINNIKYKAFIELLIQKYLNKTFNYDKENMNTILSDLNRNIEIEKFKEEYNSHKTETEKSKNLSSKSKKI